MNKPDPNQALVLWLQATVLYLWAMPYGPLAVRVRDGYDPLKDDYRRNHLRPLGCLSLMVIIALVLGGCGMVSWLGWLAWDTLSKG
jgi:hypothetical protein